MYHFAFLVLSVALFGLGAGGIFHFVSDLFRRRPEPSLSWLLLVAAGSLPLCLGLVLRIPFSPYIFDLTNVLALIFVVLLCIIPFFFCGLFITLIYLSQQKHISTLYAFDLLGAGIGCVVAIFLLEKLGATGTPWLASSLLVLASLCTSTKSNRTCVGGIAFGFWAMSALGHTNNWLELQYVKGQKEVSLEFEKWNAFSRIGVVNAGDRKLIQIDADATTEILSAKWVQKNGSDLSSEITGIVYRLRKAGTALIIGAGGGRDLVAARLAGNFALGVEINPIIVRDLMLDRYHDFSGRIYTSPGVEVVLGDARNFLERTNRQFHVIQANAADTWAATAGGGFTLAESYLYTVEGFETYLDRLTSDGILTIGRWVFEPPQQMLRVVALALEAMARRGIDYSSDKIFLVSDPSHRIGAATPGVVFIKKLPFDTDELETLREICLRRGYIVLYEPRLRGSNPFTKLINTYDRESFFKRYHLNIRPTTDDRPFFFFTLKWKDVWSVWKTPPESRKNNSGLFVLLIVFLLMLLLTTFCFILPLIFRSRGTIDFPMGLFFFAIGLAFMMLETVLIQKSILFLGHPSYSFLTVLCALLLGTSWGSWQTRRVEQNYIQEALRRSLAGVVLATASLAMCLAYWLNLDVGWPLSARILWLSLPVTGLGILLGRLFPLGLRLLDQSKIPWAWALNGSASVLGSVLAVLVAVEAGFSIVLWLVVGLYGLLTYSACRQPI